MIKLLEYKPINPYDEFIAELHIMLCLSTQIPKSFITKEEIKAAIEVCKNINE